MEASANLSSARILVVDDQPVNVAVLCKMLAASGYRNVDATTDPREVAGLYEQHRYDLVLLDIRMPHLDGFQVMERLRDIETDSYVPVLVLTAQTDIETRIRALQEGAKDFVTKPFDRLEVLGRVRNMLEVRLLHNQVREQNRQLEARVRDRTREIRETRLEVLRRLGRAAEYRDNETGLHIVRMSNYSALLALAAGLDERQADVILDASPMHDIGKIGIPDSILLKPGPLSEQEQAVMRRHTLIGADILAGHSSALLETARRVALAHHERFDGSGYPHGLAGEDIPVEARIVALCDVFDALTTLRPYKRAWNVPEALAEIARQRGRHFDPHLVDSFMSIVPEILAIRERYAEPDAPPLAEARG